MTIPNIQPGNIVRIVKGDRAVTGEVLRVINNPKDCLPQDIPFYGHWDLEYIILSREAYGRWKQNVDGGFVELVAENKETYYGSK
jgi:hypothetical protein